MIRLCCHSNLDVSVLPDNWCSTFIKSRFLAYGSQAPFAPFYLDTDGNIVSVLDGNAIMSGTFSNMGEWAAFFAMHPDIVTITGEEPIVQELSKILKLPLITKTVMQYTDGVNNVEKNTVLQPAIREVYALLVSVFDTQMPPFENWYVDVSHRVRHGLCRIAGINEEGTLVSTAMTVAECENAAIIGAVATHPAYRKKGYASTCIRNLIGQMAGGDIPKTIWISPKNDGALRLYSSLGFILSGKIGQISIKE